MGTIDQVNDFSTFAKNRLGSEPDRSIDDLYDEWRRRTFRDIDALAVQASIRDLKNGERGEPLEEFLAEFDVLSADCNLICQTPWDDGVV